MLKKSADEAIFSSFLYKYLEKKKTCLANICMFKSVHLLCNSSTNNWANSDMLDMQNKC